MTLQVAYVTICVKYHRSATLGLAGYPPSPAGRSRPPALPAPREGGTRSPVSRETVRRRFHVKPSTLGGVMFDKTKKRLLEPVERTARTAITALLIAIVALVMAVFA